MKILQGGKLDIHDLISQESLHAWKQILFGILWSKDLGELVDRSGKSLLYPEVVYLGQLMIQGLEASPLISSENVDEGGEVV